LITDNSKMSSPYRIHIPIYEGPLDLLLDLIKKQEMNIHDIQISKITGQYLDYLHQLEVQNIDVSAEFIYMAATLIYIKSKMLLPPDPFATEEDQSADPREELVQRLLEHEKEISRIDLQREEFTVAQMIAQLRSRLLASDTGSVSLIEFFDACPSRHAMIVAFLALLEMVKLQAVALIQEKQFGDILVKKSKSFDAAFDESGTLRIDAEYQ